MAGGMSCLKSKTPGEPEQTDGSSPPKRSKKDDVTWGDWMGAWKAEVGLVDLEQDRLSRAQAAFGGETLMRMKSLNVLILGCRGVGVETAKNLILSNVGSVTIWDPAPALPEDRGANFYLTEQSVGKPRAAECLAQLKSLNPYCKVEVLQAEEASLPTCLGEADRGYSTVVVTELLPRATLMALNSVSREKGIAFVLAVNTGVTTSMFSDFGPKHIISDEDGEPTQMLAVANAEVLTATDIVKVDGCKEGEKLVVLTLASDHTLQDGDMVSLDDMRGSLAAYNGKQLKVKRYGVLSPTEAKVDLKDVAVKEMLKMSTKEVMDNLAKQYEHYKSEWEASDKSKKFQERQITLFNRLVLVLEDGASADEWSSYGSGGLINSVKPILTKEYDSFEKTLVYTPNPQMMDTEAGLSGAGCWIQLALNTVLRFHEVKGRWPKLLDAADAAEFTALARTISEEQRALEGACWLQKIEWGFPSGEPIEDTDAVVARLERFSLLFASELTGFCAFLGGAAAQEVIKKTGKFLPMEQWLHHDDGILVGESKEMGKHAGGRYGFQAAVLGPDFMDAIAKQRIFLVGCGALGCEYLKGLAMMGACTSQGSKLVVTDMDRIEVSNLSRQFLFRQSDVGSSKSTSAARVVKGWNPDLQIEALEKGVGTTSEDFFDDAFWSSKDLCWNALDNVVARKYTDSCCLWHGLPLLESGTLGTKCNSDVFLPDLTQSYNDGTESDANETQIAMCTLRSFPYLPLHCIEFAKQSYFSDYMEFAPQQYEAFRNDRANFFEQLSAMSDPEQYKALKMIKGFIELQKAGKIDFCTCIKVAFDHYCKDFITSIRDLVHACDQIEKASGKPFWTGTKRKPVEAPWDPAAPPAEALEYLYATANCYAFIFNVPYIRNRGDFEEQVIALNLKVPDWSPPSGEAKVDTEEDAGDAVPAGAVEALQGELYAVDPSGLQQMEAHDFEKDDDTNFHIDFLTVGTNMRAANYDIKLSERSTVKVTAGRIIPALATTTAMICGLVDVEFMKLVKGLHKTEGALDKFYNANINLATGLQAMNMFRPDAALKKKTKLAAMPEYTTWQKVVVNGEITIKQLIEQIEERHGAKVHRLFPAENVKLCLYDHTHLPKMDWNIEVGEDGKVVVEPEAVYGAWPQLRMAVQMLSKVPEGQARNNFLNQVNKAAKSLQEVKDGFSNRFNGPVSQAYTAVARPPDSEAEKQQYFDAVFQKRPYLALQVHVVDAEGEEADLPPIRYNFR